MFRKIERDIRDYFRAGDKTALLITGARQVGKTYIIEKTGHAQYEHFVKINFLENPDARSLFADVKDAQALLLRISAISNARLIPGKTLIFLDEVQECPDIITAVKFLVQDGQYKYILSGSLLGVDLKDIRSIPVGYLDILELYPLDFEEFCIATGVSEEVLSSLRHAYEKNTPVDSIVHEKMMQLFHLYLIVGGMPAVVDKYLKTNNISEVTRLQASILRLYKKDIAKYDPENKLYLEEIFDLIPSELNAKNKRFIMKDLNENFKFSRYQNSFLWLKDAGVAHPAFCASEPKTPLLLSKATNLFKLFLSDIGLLSCMYASGIQIKILQRDEDINFGSIYENAVAQELKAHGFPLYYYNSKKHGELDFLIEHDGDVIPLEVKSGKHYTRHSALSNVLKLYPQIPKAIVLHSENTKIDGRISYLPIYMMMWIQNKSLPRDFVYKIDLEGLQ